MEKNNILSSNVTVGKCYKSFACKTNNIHQLYSTEKSSSCWSPSLSAASRGSRGFFHSVKDSLDRASAVKRVQRSHSASPCRIPNPAKAHLSVHGRVYASPDRSSAIAWARGVPSTRRWKVSPAHHQKHHRNELELKYNKYWCHILFI